MSEIARIAREETLPEHYAKFAPITRGPLFALFNLALLGIVAVPYLLFQKVFKR